ncbi:hypothetical protein FQA47_013421 [Oryzias melastigma]|uniref:Uncharacterized protein n=1 Tax=Oryzias melastigma TaxID=30732 RepID=A0A834FIG6_ORYME|nr:hypothetical protein FQA47_013421 [Oryzias melastigma]
MASPSPRGEASLSECGRMSITRSHVMALANDVPAIWAWHQSSYVTHPVLPLRYHTAPSARLGRGETRLQQTERAGRQGRREGEKV